MEHNDIVLIMVLVIMYTGIFLISGLIEIYREYKKKKETKRLNDALLDRMQTPEQKAGMKAAFDKLTNTE